MRVLFISLALVLLVVAQSSETKQCPRLLYKCREQKCAVGEELKQKFDSNGCKLGCPKCVPVTSVKQSCPKLFYKCREVQCQDGAMLFQKKDANGCNVGCPKCVPLTREALEALSKDTAKIKKACPRYKCREPKCATGEELFQKKNADGCNVGCPKCVPITKISTSKRPCPRLLYKCREQKCAVGEELKQKVDSNGCKLGCPKCVKTAESKAQLQEKKKKLSDKLELKHRDLHRKINLLRKFIKTNSSQVEVSDQEKSILKKIAVSYAEKDMKTLQRKLKFVHSFRHKLAPKKDVMSDSELFGFVAGVIGRVAAEVKMSKNKGIKKEQTAYNRKTTLPLLSVQ